MRMVRWLALLPFLAMLIGPFFVNRVDAAHFRHAVPAGLVRGLDLLTAVIMAVIFRFDPTNRDDLS